MDDIVTETPPRKRRRSETPSSHHINKRFRPEALTSSSPRIGRFDLINHNEDALPESDVPESPIAPSKEATILSVSFAPGTPTSEINDPFARLKVSSAQKKLFATPVALKSNFEGSKSVKKSARKTPGSVKSSKALPFRIKSSSASLIDHPSTVIPIASFLRVFLPICWLVGSMPRIFSTQRAEIIQQTRGEDVVMIAKVEGEKSIVVIERVSGCIYSMCTLKKDLKIKDVRIVAKTAKEMGPSIQPRRCDQSMNVDGDEWWKRMMVRNLHSTDNEEVSLHFLVKEDTSESTIQTTIEADSPSTALFMRHDSEFSADSGYASSPHNSLPNSTTSVNSQYLEALYSTKTSLAYFAKSTLSRARSELQRVEHFLAENPLISILQNLIFKMDDFNAKYDEFIPSAVQENVYSTTFIVTDEERKYLIQKFKRNGGEDDEINESTLQREINDLKIRETQLQIIILAELLALHEESKDTQECLNRSIQDDYEQLLISHLDRLSISGMLETDNDFSEQFMREILLPFYSSRLPRILDMMGAPMDFTSPIKQPTKKSHPKSVPRQSILSPNTLNRISRPRRQELSPTPFPVITSRKTFKSTTPKKQKLSKSAGVLKRLQKTEVNMRHSVPSKKVRKANGGGMMAWGSQQQRVEPVGLMSLDDGAEVQVPATPAPKKRGVFT